MKSILNNSKIYIYCVIVLLTVFSSSIYLSSKEQVQETSFDLYLTDFESVDLKDFETLNDQGINFYVHKFLYTVALTNNEEFIEMQPTYFFGETKFDEKTLRDSVINIELDSDMQIDGLKTIIQMELDQDILIFQNLPYASSTASFKKLAIIFLIIFYIFTFINIIGRIVRNQNLIFVKVLNGCKKREIIFEVAEILTIKHYFTLLIFSVISVLLITKVFSTDSLISILISLLVIFLIELSIYVFTDIFYQAIIKWSSTSFLKTRLKLRTLSSILFIFLGITTFALTITIVTGFDNARISIEEINRNSYSDEQLNDLYYFEKLSANIANSDEQNIEVGDDSLIFNYSKDIMNNYSLLITDNYYIENFVSKDYNLQEDTYYAFNEENCNAINDNLNNDFIGYNCTVIDENKILNDYDYVLIQPRYNISDGFINTSDKETAEAELIKVGRTKDSHLYFGTYEDFIKGTTSKYLKEILISILIVIFVIVLYIYLIKIYLEIRMILNSDLYIKKIVEGNTFFKRYNNIILNIILEYIIVILVCMFIYNNYLLLISEFILLLLVTLLIIYLIDKLYIKKKFIERIKLND